MQSNEFVVVFVADKRPKQRRIATELLLVFYQTNKAKCGKILKRFQLYHIRRRPGVTPVIALKTQSKKNLNKEQVLIILNRSHVKTFKRSNGNFVLYFGYSLNLRCRIFVDVPLMIFTSVQK